MCVIPVPLQMLSILLGSDSIDARDACPKIQHTVSEHVVFMYVFIQPMSKN